MEITKKKRYVTPALCIVSSNTEDIMKIPSCEKDPWGEAKDNNFSTDNSDGSSDGNNPWGSNNSSPWGE